MAAWTAPPSSYAEQLLDAIGAVQRDLRRPAPSARELIPVLGLGLAVPGHSGAAMPGGPAALLRAACGLCSRTALGSRLSSTLGPRPLRCSAAPRPGRCSGRARRGWAALGPLGRSARPRCSSRPVAAAPAGGPRRCSARPPSGPCGFATSPRASGRVGRVAPCGAPGCSRPASRPFGFGASPRCSGAAPGRRVDAGPRPRFPALHPGYEATGTTAQSRRKNIIPNRKPAATASEIAVKGCRSIEVLSASPSEEDASRT